MMSFIELCLKSYEIILVPSRKLRNIKAYESMAKFPGPTVQHLFSSFYIILFDLLIHCNPYVLTLGGFLNLHTCWTPNLLPCRGCSEGGRTAFSSAIGKRLGFKNPVTSWNARFFAGPFCRKFIDSSRPNNLHFVHQRFILLVCQIERWFPTLIPHRYRAGANFQEQITPEKLQLSIRFHPY